MAVEVHYIKCLLRDQRRKAGLTQLELAQILGVSKNRISEYELCKRYMSLTTAIKIAYVLGCNIGELYEYRIVGRRRG